ncbi:hypothetical protein M2171_008518 [Bradyrhizobium japonicum USDA 38]|nr:hypothetical protein [Bradyrhizobium japonicum]MCS3899385.1 hypothetical protein [Bradyrhizobium japonicum USDA 38]MCS3942439.1 hypothetical protein [Bradyrhizobium japonicum]
MPMIGMGMIIQQVLLAIKVITVITGTAMLTLLVLLVLLGSVPK